MNSRFVFRQSWFATGVAFFLGALQLTVLVHVEVTAQANGYPPSIGWMFLIALVFGFVVYHGYGFFDRMR